MKQVTKLRLLAKIDKKSLSKLLNAFLNEQDNSYRDEWYTSPFGIAESVISNFKK